MVVDACNPSTVEEEAGVLLGGQGQFGLHRKTLSYKTLPHKLKKIPIKSIKYTIIVLELKTTTTKKTHK